MQLDALWNMHIEHTIKEHTIKIEQLIVCHLIGRRLAKSF